MSLVGNLEDLSLPDILQIVSLSKKSGILLLEREGQQGKIIIRQGKVIQTVSPRPGKTLGELLAGRGLLRPEDLKRALEIQRAGGNRDLLGGILVQQKLIDLATLEKIVQEQIEDAIVFFLTWKEGTFSFELADIQGRGEFSVDPQAFILEHGIDTQWLVLEGTRLIDERARRGEGPPPPDDGLAAEASAETSFADVADAAAEPRAVVLVDDDDGFREALGERLARAGLRVVACGGVAEGLRALAAEAGRTPPPLLVTDVVMPTADSRGFLGGLELLEQARREHPAVPAAAITAYPDENVRARVQELGGRFFLKPPGGGDAALAAFAGQLAADLAGEPGAPAAAPAAAAAVAPEAAPDRTPAGPAPEPTRGPVGEPEGEPAAETAPPAAAGSPPLPERERVLAALRETKAALGRHEEAIAAAGVGPGEMPLLRDMLEELQAPRATSEIGLLILRFAAELINRAVLFIVKGGKAVGLGGFGVEASPSGASRGIRGIAVPLDEPSVLADVVHGRAPVRGPLAATAWNRSLLEQLGGRTPAEAVALPLLSGGKVRVILYADNLPEERPLHGVEALAVFLRQAGLTLEKVLLERRLQELGEGPAAAPARPEKQRVGGRAR